MSKTIDSITNYFQMNDQIATSGQPDAEQIKAISKAGYTTIINLTPHINQDALPNEGQLAAASFMSYINIPVLYEDPQIEQFEMFCKMMDILANEKVWIHCVKNSRCSVFVYLYLRYRRGYSEEQAMSPMYKQWTPDETWLEFMQEVVNDLSDKGLLAHNQNQDAA